MSVCFPPFCVCVLLYTSPCLLCVFVPRVLKHSQRDHASRVKLAMMHPHSDGEAARCILFMCVLFYKEEGEEKKKDPSLVLLLFLMFRGETVIVLLTSNSTCSNPSYCHGRARLFQSLLWPSSQSLPLGLQCIFFFLCRESLLRIDVALYFLVFFDLCNPASLNSQMRLCFLLPASTSSSPSSSHTCISLLFFAILLDRPHQRNAVSLPD